MLKTEVISCEKCGCTYFETVRANKFSSTASRGSPFTLNSVYADDMLLLRCLKCGTLSDGGAMSTLVSRRSLSLFTDLLVEVGIEPSDSEEQ